jgi:hypothetical protein
MGDITGDTMSDEEKVLREVFDMWGRGLDGVLGSFTDHCTPDIRWWNSARGAVEGLDGPSRGGQ